MVGARKREPGQTPTSVGRLPPYLGKIAVRRSFGIEDYVDRGSAMPWSTLPCRSGAIPALLARPTGPRHLERSPCASRDRRFPCLLVFKSFFPTPLLVIRISSRLASSPLNRRGVRSFRVRARSCFLLAPRVLSRVERCARGSRIFPRRPPSMRAP